MSNWTAVTTRPQREEKAEDVIRRHGVKTFRPVEIRVSRKRLAKGQTPKLRRVGLCPRYVFAGSTCAEQLGIIMADDHAAPKPSIAGLLGIARDEALEPLRAIDGRETDQNAPAKITKPVVGTLVSLRSGPFEGWNVLVTALHGNSFSATACDKYPLRLPYTHLHPG